MSRATRHRRAQQILREWEAERVASGTAAQTEPHPLCVVFALSSTVMLITFCACLGALLHGGRIADYVGKDQSVAAMICVGLYGAMSPFFWWAVLTDSLPPESAWRHPLRAFAKGLACIASPDDVAWREEWPALLIRQSGEPRRPLCITLTVTGWAWAALRSRAGWMLDVCLQSDNVCALATFGATGSATLAAWDAAGITEAIITVIGTFIGCVAAVDGLCRWRGIELPRPKKK